MAVPAQLFRLEQLDLELERQESALADLRRRQQRNPEWERAEATLTTLRSQEATLAAEQRGLERDLADLQAKIERDGKRMYSGSIVDVRELTSIEKELAHHRAQCNELEDRLIDIMERVEVLQADIATRSREAKSLLERWQDDRPSREGEAEALTDSAAGLRTEREELLSTIEPHALNTYTRLRKASGHAVSHVSGGVCQWCRVVIPQKDIQHARAGALVTCSNCARILFVG